MDLPAYLWWRQDRQLAANSSICLPSTWHLSCLRARDQRASPVWLTLLFAAHVSWAQRECVHLCWRDASWVMPQPFPSQQIILLQGSSPEPEHLCMCRSLPEEEEEESFIHPQRDEITLFTICSVHKHQCTWMWTHTVTDRSVRVTKLPSTGPHRAFGG